MSDEKVYDLSIRLNNVITNDPCAICGSRTDPTGVDLMTEDNQLVCVLCGRKHAPALQGLLDLANAAQGYVEADQRQYTPASEQPEPF